MKKLIIMLVMLLAIGCESCYCSKIVETAEECMDKCSEILDQGDFHDEVLDAVLQIVYNDCLELCELRYEEKMEGACE
jgi:hypothetical protein